MNQRMSWTCMTCFAGGSSPSPTAITEARLAHAQESPNCGSIVIEWK